MFFHMDQHGVDGRDKLSQNLKNILRFFLLYVWEEVVLPGTALSHKPQEYDYEYL